MLQFHNFNGRQVLASLGLGARLVASDEEQGGVHHCSAVQHRRHENVVTRAVNEADVSDEAEFKAVHLEDIFLCRAGRSVAYWALTSRVFAFVYFGVGITQLDCDVALKFVLEPDRVDPGERLDHRGLAVGHVADGADVDRCLSRDHFRGEGGQLGHVQGRQILRKCNSRNEILVILQISMCLSLKDFQDTCFAR